MMVGLISVSVLDAADRLSAEQMSKAMADPRFWAQHIGLKKKQGMCVTESCTFSVRCVTSL
jgi:hypothetical protein